ncbi:glycosyltransferase family 2 protein [Granulicatella sp.]
MKEELISLVLPIYNVERYLRLCLDSLLEKTYTNFEVLMIIDGSPDEFVRELPKLEIKDNSYSNPWAKLFKRE